MSGDLEALTDKEKQTLRLIARGHDAKSMARHLGISVHTVNERLRFARRKMSVTSSREAARILLNREGEGPKSFGNKPLGEAGHAESMSGQGPSKDRGEAHRHSTFIIAGACIMSLILTALALFTTPGPTSQTAPNGSAAIVARPDAALVATAREWLGLVDSGRWGESWEASGSAFRKLNTTAQWASVSEQVRVPLGAALSRDAWSQQSLPAPPQGYEVLKFRTSFASKSGAIETVTLEREASSWRVVGYIID